MIPFIIFSSGRLHNENGDDRAEENSAIVTKVPFMDETTTQYIETSTQFLPTIPTPKINEEDKRDSNINSTDNVKPRGRLLNLNIDELNSFEHNHTEISSKNKKIVPDLSDVNLDDDDFDDMKFMNKDDYTIPKQDNSVPDATDDISDKFFTHLQAPFHQLHIGDKSSAEIDMCKDNGITYKVNISFS